MVRAGIELFDNLNLLMVPSVSNAFTIRCHYRSVLRVPTPAPSRVVQTLAAKTSSMAKITEKVLKKRVREIFEAGDLEQLTEKKIRAQIQSELGELGKENEAVIHQEIETMLEELAGDDDDEGCEDEQQSGTSVVNGHEYLLRIGKLKNLVVKKHNKKVRIDLRTWFKASDGIEKPTGKGISLSFTEWQRLCKSINQLITALQNKDTDVMVELASQRQATVSEFKGTVLVQVREFYMADGEKKPGKKGIALDAAALMTLSDHEAEITSHAIKLGASAEADESTATAKPTAKAQAKVVAEPAGTSKAAASGSEDKDANVIDLGGNKRVTLSAYSGSSMVDLREWYQKGSELLPGKKGISLQLSDWKAIVDACPAITAALTSKNMEYQLSLTNKRSVRISEFKGKVYVNVREYYMKGGQEMPGVKGLSMSQEQWNKLVEGTQRFTAAVQND